MAESKQDYSGGDTVANSDLNQISENATKAGGFEDDLNAGETINGATLPVPVYQDDADGEVYACDGNDTTKLDFIGFAISNSTDGNPIEVQTGTGSIVDGFTGLTAGVRYYLQDAVGTIGTSAGTYPVEVGRAISATQILISEKTLIRSGTGTNQTAAITENDDETIAVGFRPKLIILTADVSAQIRENNPGDISSAKSGIIMFMGTTAVFGYGASMSNEDFDAPSSPITGGASNHDVTFGPMTSFSVTASVTTHSMQADLQVNAVSDDGFTLRSAFTQADSEDPNGYVQNIKWVAIG